jgi:hypothetical protein
MINKLKKTRVGLYLDSATLGIIVTLARQSGASQSEIVRRLIHRGMASQN